LLTEFLRRPDSESLPMTVFALKGLSIVQVDIRTGLVTTTKYSADILN
jgi:hypothetical protein